MSVKIIALFAVRISADNKTSSSVAGPETLNTLRPKLFISTDSSPGITTISNLFLVLAPKSSCMILGPWKFHPQIIMCALCLRVIILPPFIVKNAATAIKYVAKMSPSKRPTSISNLA